MVREATGGIPALAEQFMHESAEAINDGTMSIR
jgi:hypothetical protein